MSRRCRRQRVGRVPVAEPAHRVQVATSSGWEHQPRKHRQAQPPRLLALRGQPGLVGVDPRQVEAVEQRLGQRLGHRAQPVERTRPCRGESRGGSRRSTAALARSRATPAPDPRRPAGAPSFDQRGGSCSAPIGATPAGRRAAPRRSRRAARADAVGCQREVSQKRPGLARRGQRRRRAARTTRNSPRTCSIRSTGIELVQDARHKITTQHCATSTLITTLTTTRTGHEGRGQYSAHYLRRGRRTGSGEHSLFGARSRPTAITAPRQSRRPRRLNE